ncbi:hypothetical protein HY969_02380 [Candidatus Kaiserbacteria bacterium]|nr:hypothetical protein [Candidatus Kaiserbacteria bacterium]
MAKDFFEDIDVHPEAGGAQSKQPFSAAPPASAAPERSIRNISVPSRRIPVREKPIDMRQDMDMPQPPRPRRTRFAIWVLAALAVLLLGGAIAYFTFFSKTSVDVTPRTHQVTFDESTQFTAYPAADAASGTITYTLQTTTIEDSTSVKATGVEKTEDRASGTITVYNEYSTSPVRLIKNTRFQTQNGLVYRIPASAEVPGMKGAQPGQVTVTVIADQPGTEYNVGPQDKFTLPGLKSTPPMYAGVYGRSSAAMSGGFVGDKPSVSEGDLENARSQLRAQLLEKARAAALAYASGGALVFPELVKITYESLPTAADGAGAAKVTERAIVEIPVFSEDNFSQSVAQAVSADASESKVQFVPNEGFAVSPAGEAQVIGTDPIAFKMIGSALLVWEVDASALKQALVGRDQGAFETVISGFSGVEKAEAHIAPFWKKQFPQDPDDIMLTILEPVAL